EQLGNQPRESYKVETLVGQLHSAAFQVKQKTTIPVLLPDKIPPLRQSKLYVENEADRDMYNITVGTEPHCGVNACLVAVFRAENGSEPPGPGEVDKVIT